MKLRKFLLAMLLAIVAAVFAACGDTEEEDDGDIYKRTITPTPTATPTASAGVITPGADPTPTTAPEKPKYVIVLDPGHGGRWPGANSAGSVSPELVEKPLTLKISQKLKEYLETHYEGVKVYLTREGEDALSDDLGEDLRKRVNVGVEKNADILVSIHLNASDYHNQHGAMVCISKQQNITKQSKQLADCILNKLTELGLQNNGTLKRDSGDTFDANGVPVDYYAICRHGASHDLIAIILESCFIDNTVDNWILQTDEAIGQLVEKQAEGIMEYLTKYYVKGGAAQG